MVTSITNGLQAFLEFIHPLGVMSSIFWTIPLLRWSFGRLRIKVVLTLSLLRRIAFSLLLFLLALAGGSVRLGTLLPLPSVCQQLSYHCLEVVDRLLLNLKHLLLLLLHLSLLFDPFSHLVYICECLFLHIRFGWLRFYDSEVLIAYFNALGQGIVVY